MGACNCADSSGRFADKKEHPDTFAQMQQKEGSFVSAGFNSSTATAISLPCGQR